jgi:hypothetical protein
MCIAAQLLRFGGQMSRNRSATFNRNSFIMGNNDLLKTTTNIFAPWRLGEQ